MIRQAIELSNLEEEVRQKKIEVQEVEQQKQLRTAELASIEVVTKLNKPEKEQKVEVIAQAVASEQPTIAKQLTKVKMTEE